MKFIVELHQTMSFSLYALPTIASYSIDFTKFLDIIKPTWNIPATFIMLFYK